MANADDNDNPKMTPMDRLFLVFLLGVLILTAWLGYQAYLEGLRTETTKQSGEAWAKWLTTSGAARFEANYPLSVCSPVDASTNQPHTWGECFKAAIQTEELSTRINPFSQALIAVVEKCDADEHTTTGQMILQKALPTPPGSAIPFDLTSLVDTDVIDKKMQIHVTVCDGGDYPIKIAEVEF